METRRQTCGNCPHLTYTEVAGLRCYGCAKNGNMVPHLAKQGLAVFWRVPQHCPLTDDEVQKRPDTEKAPESVWTRVSYVNAHA